jgi:hypothetical protein
MKSNPHLASDFLQTVRVALARLKRELQRDYQRAYPQLREIIRLVLDEEEGNAWKLSPFPHLIFPDLVEAHIATLNLEPVDTRHHPVTRTRTLSEFPNLQPAFA